ncbi:MAG: flavin reductase family protein [Gammaproteobacteria bacterium]|nr:flavin reductase family protein [Gammaproteobacteria bacterium]
MEIKLNNLAPTEIYHLMTQTVIPRPIAWVLTESSQDNFNLAPFSYFSAVCSAPPLLMFSVGKKPNGDDKDTVVNARASKKMVIHIASEDMYKEVTDSAATLDHGESELSLTGLETTEFAGFELPRLKDCKIAFGCKLHEIQHIGAVPQTLVFAEIETIYVADDVVVKDQKGRDKIAAELIKPLARLGAAEYASFGEVITQVRPK